MEMDQIPGIHSGFKVRRRLYVIIEFTTVTFIIYSCPTMTCCRIFKGRYVTKLSSKLLIDW